MLLLQEFFAQILSEHFVKARLGAKKQGDVLHADLCDLFHTLPGAILHSEISEFEFDNFIRRVKEYGYEDSLRQWVDLFSSSYPDMVQALVDQLKNRIEAALEK